MLERVLFRRGAWLPAHRPDFDCWCRPTVREEGDCILNIHRAVPICADPRQRAFITGLTEAPV